MAKTPKTPKAPKGGPKKPCKTARMADVAAFARKSIEGAMEWGTARVFVPAGC